MAPCVLTDNASGVEYCRDTCLVQAIICYTSFPDPAKLKASERLFGPWTFCSIAVVAHTYVLPLPCLRRSAVPCPKVGAKRVQAYDRATSLRIRVHPKVKNARLQWCTAEANKNKRTSLRATRSAPAEGANVRSGATLDAQRAAWLE